MNSNIKINIWLLISLAINSCNTFQNTDAAYNNIIERYLVNTTINEGQLIIIHSDNMGCIGCIGLVDANIDLLLSKNIIVITNKIRPNNNIKNYVFDTYNLIDSIDWGYINPTFFINRNGNYEPLFEVTSENIDRFYEVLDL
jgi:hypothetical protein